MNSAHDDDRHFSDRREELVGSHFLVTLVAMLIIAALVLTGAWLQMRGARTAKLVSAHAELLERGVRASSGRSPGG